ncbi:hypothetical protein CASFOL_013281 [Castilleja foliolosa]|uniref:Uncharacterized protein n=1 Tax=Castilleja foliolosa TaxID=1961234 RepID=A0ABD3DLE2_9LAMI
MTSMEHVLISPDDEAGVVALAACASHIFPKALKAAIELDIFEIVGRAHGDGLSPSEIASQLPTGNVDRTVVVLDSLLRLLVTRSLLTCSICKLANGSIERRYGLALAGRFFVGDENGGSLVPYFDYVSRDEPMQQISFKDAVLEGGNIFEKPHGKSYYGSLASDPESGRIFDNAMGAHSTMLMKKVVKIYNGFEGLSSLVNVGGGNGATLDSIVSNFPSIRAINFDLQHVVQIAPSYIGMEHIGGDMFLEVPKGEAILLKFVLHNWGDEQCTKLLNNCYKALPNKGKVIVMECIMPNSPQTDHIHATYVSQQDIVMAILSQGKERTEDEFKAMAMGAGFAEFKVVCCVYGIWIMEFYKLVQPNQIIG